MTVLVMVLAAGAALGVALVVSGLTLRVVPPPRPRTSAHRPALLRRRVALAAGLAVVTGLVTRWPIAALGMCAIGWFSPELFGSRSAQVRATARTEAIASWTEMLRDTISGAHGLEEAIATTAAVAPDAIRVEVTDLAVRLERQSLEESLRSFATDLAHPTADLVVASLGLAAAGAVGDLGELLGTLAIAARDEAGMRLRVDAARARLRTAVRVIAGCTGLTALGLVVLNRPYVAVYGTAVGQLVLAVVAGLWGLSLWWLSRLGTFISPERFLAQREDPASLAAP